MRWGTTSIERVIFHRKPFNPQKGIQRNSWATLDAEWAALIAGYSKGFQQMLSTELCRIKKIPSRKWVLIVWIKTQGDAHPVSQYQGFLWSSTAGSMETLSPWRLRFWTSNKPTSSIIKTKAIYKTCKESSSGMVTHMRRTAGWKTTFRGGKWSSFRRLYLGRRKRSSSFSC